MTRDVLRFSYSGNNIVNSGYSLNLDNGVFVLDAGVNMDVDGSSNSTGSGLSISPKSLSCSGSAITGMNFTATIECEDDVLTGSVGGAHIIMPMTVETVFGGGKFVLPPNTPGGAAFGLPVKNISAGEASPPQPPVEGEQSQVSEEQSEQ